ncbi:MAG: hypothetical protein WD825_00150 [Gemmatimonadaceae bacterium]
MTTSTASTIPRQTKAWDTLRTSEPLTVPARREQRRLLTDPIVAKLTLRSSEVRVEVHHPEPAWLYPVLDRLQHLSKLVEGWDSYGGQPPTDKSIFGALAVISQVLKYESAAPPIVPLSEGGVQVEWHGGGEELEIRVGPNGEISAFRFDERAGRGEEIDQVALSNLSRLLALTGTR